MPPIGSLHRPPGPLQLGVMERLARGQNWPTRNLRPWVRRPASEEGPAIPAVLAFRIVHHSLLALASHLTHSASSMLSLNSILSCYAQVKAHDNGWLAGFNIVAVSAGLPNHRRFCP